MENMNEIRKRQMFEMKNCFKFGGYIKLNKYLNDNLIDDMTLEEIAFVLGVTRERVRQIESMALKKLKHPKIVSKFRQYKDIPKYPEMELS